MYFIDLEMKGLVAPDSSSRFSVPPPQPKSRGTRCSYSRVVLGLPLSSGSAPLTILILFLLFLPLEKTKKKKTLKKRSPNLRVLSPPAVGAAPRIHSSSGGLFFLVVYSCKVGVNLAALVRIIKALQTAQPTRVTSKE